MGMIDKSLTKENIQSVFVDKIVSSNVRFLPSLSNNFGMMGIPGTKLTAKKYHKTSSGGQQATGGVDADQRTIVTCITYDMCVEEE